MESRVTEVLLEVLDGDYPDLSGESVASRSTCSLSFVTSCTSFLGSSLAISKYSLIFVVRGTPQGDVAPPRPLSHHWLSGRGLLLYIIGVYLALSINDNEELFNLLYLLTSLLGVC